MKTDKYSCIKASLLALTGAVALGAMADNPIVPPGMYCADPSAHQWRPGGAVYIYGSRDEAKDYYCSYDYDVWESSDMDSFKLHPYVFSSKGEEDEVLYNEELLFAPDCLEKDGRYYLFYCQGGSPDVEGVAIGDSPAGPFRKGTLLEGAWQIDPAAFVDEDGQHYLFYGQFSAKCARLADDLKSIDKSSIKDGIITEKDHFFHEGIQVLKRGDWYYLVYADIQRRGMPTCIGYAMSRNLTGPYEYKGIIVDNFGCDPFVWNNHGSIAEVDGKWYVFYHRSTNGSERMRKACVEPITFNPDGTINEVEMTTQGASGPLDPFKVMPAAKACYLTGDARITVREMGDYRTGKEGVEELTDIRDMNTAAFRYFDFTREPQNISVTLKPQAGGVIEVYANTLSLPRLAVIQVPEGDGKTPVTLTVSVTPEPEMSLLGVRPVFFRFRGEQGKDICSMLDFKFD